MRTVEEIDKEIHELEEKLEHVEGRPTEVYTRIVGYYRSLKNWNRGKREEYSHRVLFDIQDAPAAQHAVDAAAKAPTAPADHTEPELKRYLYFFRETCPNCPPVRALLSGLGIPGKEMNVDSEEGMRAALVHGIYAAPTVIFFNSRGNEVYRTSSSLELSALKIPQMA